MTVPVNIRRKRCSTCSPFRRNWDIGRVNRVDGGRFAFRPNGALALQITLHVQCQAQSRLTGDIAVAADYDESGARRRHRRTETHDVADIIADTDVLYVTRVQKERFSDLSEYEQVKNQYEITTELMTHAKEKMVIMHPLPRVGEIHYDVDRDPRAAYFRQVRNGMYIRMALLAGVLGRA